jgi:hypothetical protein
MHRGRLMHEGTLDELKRETGCETIAQMFRHVLHEKSHAGEAP